MESSYRPLSLLVERGKEAEFTDRLSEETPLYSLPSDQIRQLVGYDFHRGVMACGERQELPGIDELLFEADQTSIALAILGVSEHENLGGIIRTATALGIERLLVGPNTVDPFSRRVIRVSMATVFKQRLYRLDQPETQLALLQQSRGVRIIATTLDADATSLDEFLMDDRDSIVIVGNEANGVDPQIQRIATDRVTIQMKLGTDSLNVSVAAAIFIYQLTGRRRS